MSFSFDAETIISGAISSLKFENNDCFVEHCQILVYYLQKQAADQTLKEKVIFQVCIPYLTKAHRSNHANHLAGTLLKLCCCSLVFPKIFLHCLNSLKVHVDNEKYATESTEVLPEISIQNLIFILHLLNNLEMEKDFTDVFDVCMNLIESDFISESDFNSINSFVSIIYDASNNAEDKRLWRCISFLSDKKEIKKLLILLAVNVTHLTMSPDMIECESFWRILQDGLIDEDPLTRKRGLYVLKWLLNYLSTIKKFSTKFVNNDLPLMFWSEEKNEKFWSIWKTIILLFETLEEKQLHVIAPVLASMEIVFDAACLKDGGSVVCLKDDLNFLHFSWFLVLLRRIMTHECKALCKWGLQYALQMDLVKFPLLLQKNLSFIFNDLMESLKSIYVFNCDDDVQHGNPPVVYSMLESFFVNLLKNSNYEQKRFFFSKILLLLSNVDLCDLSLVYITRAFSTLQLVDSWSTDEINLLKKFLFNFLPLNRIEYQQVIFHSVTSFFTLNCKSSNDNFEDGIEIFIRGLNESLLAYNDCCWSVWIKWLRSFGTDNISSETLSLMLLSNTASTKFVIVSFILGLEKSIDISPITDVILKLNTNPYLDKKKKQSAFQIISNFLKIIKNGVQVKEDIDSSLHTLLDYLGCLLKDIADYFILQMSSSLQHGYIEECLGVVSQYISLASRSKYFKNVCKPAINILCFNIQQIIPAQLALLKEHLYSDSFSVVNCCQAISIFLKINMIYEQPCAFHHQELIFTFLNVNRSLLNKLCRNSLTYFTCDTFIAACWECFSILYTYSESKKEIVKQKECILKQFYIDMDLSSYATQEIILEFSKHLSSLFLENLGCINTLITFLHKVIRETSNDRLFWRIYQNCIAGIIHPELLQIKDLFDIIRSCWLHLYELGMRKSGIVNIAFDEFTKACRAIGTNAGSSVEQYIDILVEVCVFGPLHNKDVKPYNHLIDFLNAEKCYNIVPKLNSVLFQDRYVRASLVNFLLEMQSLPGFDQVYVQFLFKLLKYESTVLKSKFVYYPSSLMHRQKIRIWQMVLVLLDLLPSGFEYENLLDILYDSLTIDNQPSVRRFIEWSIVHIYIKNPHFIKSLWKKMEVATEKILTTVVNVLSISIQLAKLLDVEDFVDFSFTAIPLILPWTQAQHMTSRILSQTALKVIWNRIIDVDHVQLKEKFSLIEHCFTLTEKNSSVVKHRLEISKNFFYHSFDPVRHYSLESIFKGVLSHTELQSDEWIPVEYFHCNWKVKNLKLLDDGKRSFQFSHSNNEDILNGVLLDKQLTDIQKKIMPWRVLPPSDDQVLRSEFARKQDMKKSDLILCGVLVEKIPNLGGLCRTAEIFGISSFLIGSQRYINEPEFQSLSVSAEKWLDIQQVLPIKLTQYLLDLKEDGYTLVGVEQTAKSKKIGDFVFPKKSVLILGNERTGIPVDLIQILDECVEIPQVGIIRSLNVHISGAIMIWEYCKQHVFSE